VRTLWQRKKLLLYTAVIILIGVLLLQLDVKFKDDQDGLTAAEPFIEPEIIQTELMPKDENFKPIAENDLLILKFDVTSGHFIVEDKRNGNIIRSYPDPTHWDNAGIGGIWLNHLASPVMFDHIDFNLPGARPLQASLLSSNGSISDIEWIDGGIKLTYDMPDLGFTIPVQIRIQDDYVETKIIDAELKEQGKTNLLWLRLYPFLGAQQSVGQDGYLVVPDGSGALIPFKQKCMNINKIYQEPVYGPDYSFQFAENSRNSVKMPVYGMKSGNQAFVSVIEQGGEYTDIFASPSGVYSNYNWIAPQMTYRSSYNVVTNRNRNRGFKTYNEEERFGTDRVVRTYLLDSNEADYVGMASRYRKFLMEEKGLTPLKPETSGVPLYLTILGADTEQGSFTDRYITATTTSQAMQMVQKLYGLGIERMSITYLGAQEDGFSNLGGYYPVDQRIGGNEGLKQFVAFAHSLDIPVYLGVNYEFNDSGNKGYRARYHGVRNLAGTLIELSRFRDTASVVSKKYIKNVLQKDLPKYKALGIDGLQLIRTGQTTISDFNSKHGGNRTQSIQTQNEIFTMIQESLGSVQGDDSNHYAVGTVKHIHDITNDYSYDLFSDRAIPFAQIALHGLVSYTTEYENDREQYRNDFLRDIEYGALPSYLFTAAQTSQLKSAYGIQPKSSYYPDWENEAVREYQRYNEALGEVQGQFIVGHQQIASGVNETTYANGKRIIVNYNKQPYRHNNVEIPAQDFVVMEGGSNP